MKPSRKYKVVGHPLPKGMSACIKGFTVGVRKKERECPSWLLAISEKEPCEWCGVVFGRHLSVNCKIQESIDSGVISFPKGLDREDRIEFIREKLKELDNEKE